MGWLAHAKLDARTEKNADVRIDRAARAAAVIAEHRVGHALTVERNARRIPVRINLREDVLPHELAEPAAFDALVRKIGATSEGAANVFSWRSGADPSATSSRKARTRRDRSPSCAGSAARRSTDSTSAGRRRRA